MTIFEDSLEYHAKSPKGKISLKISKPVKDKSDLALAYTPGVGGVAKAISENPEKVWEYTNRGNSVAVVSDGTAVLGLGNIGPEAGLPVMEGKAVLFKKFADIDAFAICAKIEKDENYVENFVEFLKALVPSFGAINLEDVAAPGCFEIMERAAASLQCAIVHDDQDGTGVILLAALNNALKICGKKKAEVKIVFSGAGAAGIACARMFAADGIQKKNIFMCDSKGLIVNEREDLNEQKKEFAQNGKSMNLAEAMKGADVFVGVSRAGIVNAEMVRGMAKDPIIFAMANPIPEIMPDEAMAAGAKIVATGRSDFPNQVNNALGFPGIFRGVLDTRASSVNLEMRLAASRAIAGLANVGAGEIIPSIFDARVVPKIARAVAEAAMETGVAKVKIEDLERYEGEIAQRVAKN